MARKKHFVTRNITTTHVTALTYNNDTNETKQEKFSVPRQYKSNEDLLKILRELFETATIKIATILSSNVVVERYAQEESDFIKNSIKLTNNDEETLDEESEEYEETEETEE